MKTLSVLLLSSALLVACSSSAKHATTPSTTTTASAQTLQLTTSAFTNNGTIPRVYTCNGAGTKPALTITGTPPAGTQSLALVVHDPDAPVPGGFTHWVVVDIAPTSHAIGGRDIVPWRPPCPPSGTHHYRFTLYAERTAPKTAADIPKAAITQVTLVGLYAHAR